MINTRGLLPCLAMLLFSPGYFSPLVAANWPQWRGPQADGVSLETGLPLAWSETAGVAWRLEIPGWGTSTPAIWGDALFVTTESDGALLLLQVSRQAKAVAWQQRVGTGTAERTDRLVKSDEERRKQRFHDTHNFASPSPVTDGEVVIAHFGNGDLASFDFTGKQLWRRNLQDEHGTYTIWWGHANSPVLHGDLVISICLQDSLADLPGKPSESYVIAHDKRSGKQAWKTLRTTGSKSEPCDSYIAPVFHRAAAGPEMLVVGSGELDAYDPLTGVRRWRLPGLGGNRTITGPTLAHGMCFATVGMRGPLLAVKLADRKGDAPQEDIVWRHTRGTPDTPCPVVWGETVFIVSDNGIATALDARTGNVHWSERLEGDYRASPVAAEGRVYFLNRKGLTTVVAATSKFERLAQNALADETLASPAIADGKLYLRGRKGIYCVEKQK